MRYLSLCILIITFLFSCKDSKNLPDVSSIKVDAPIQRFDNDFYNTKIATPERLQMLQAKYGRLLDIFLYNTTITERAQMGMNMSAVIDEFNKIHQPLYDSTQVKYKDLHWLEKDLAKGFQYYKYYFPEFNVPKTFAMVDGFYPDDPSSYSGVTYSSGTLILRLQMFLGQNFTGYDPEVYYDYLKRKFEKEYILRNAFAEIINQKFKPITPGSTLIENMVDAGKRIYLLDQVLPFVSDEIKLGYTKQQLKICKENEMNIWSHFVNSDNLFDVEPSIIKSYVGENPFTKEIGPDIAGNIGAFVGWQIVKSYIAKNKGITPAKLMDTDNKRIYTEAKYKP
jgi:hypothetical protein